MHAQQHPTNIFSVPFTNCFTQFLLNGQPPVNLRFYTLQQHKKFICQQLPNRNGIYYYATMHDESRGIPVYSAYVLHGGNVNFRAQGQFQWIRTAGNVFTCTLKPRDEPPFRLSLQSYIWQSSLPMKYIDMHSICLEAKLPNKWRTRDRLLLHSSRDLWDRVLPITLPRRPLWRMNFVALK